MDTLIFYNERKGYEKPLILKLTPIFEYLKSCGLKEI